MIISDVKQMLMSAHIHSSNEFETQLNASKTGKTTSEQVLKARVLADEIQRLLELVGKTNADAHDTRATQPLRAEENVKIIRTDNPTLHGRQPKAGWYAEF